MRNTRIALTTLAPLVAGAAAATDPSAPSNPAGAAPAAEGPMIDQDQALYALGYALWRNLQSFDLTADEIAAVQRGLSDAAKGVPPTVTIEEARPRLDAMRKERGERKLVAAKEEGAAYVAKATAEPGAVKSESGLVYRELVAGTGPSPTKADRVKVHYRGTLIDGTEFDSSYKRNAPTEFPLNRVIGCWTEGLGMMKVGGKANLVCPADIAYGDKGRPSIPPGATLVFEVELLEVVAQDPPKPPAEATPQPEEE